MSIWDFPKIRVPYFGVLISKDPTIAGTILGSPIFGNPHLPADETADPAEDAEDFLEITIREKGSGLWAEDGSQPSRQGSHVRGA